MPARETYVRALVRIGPCEFIAGLEIRDGDVCTPLRRRLRAEMEIALIGSSDDDFVVAKAIEQRIVKFWPTRAYFIEVSHEPDEGWVQVFLPYGLPQGT